jgi:hypothetical protein
VNLGQSGQYTKQASKQLTVKLAVGGELCFAQFDVALVLLTKRIAGLYHGKHFETAIVLTLTVFTNWHRVLKFLNQGQLVGIGFG